jgi:hypothetical protein
VSGPSATPARVACTPDSRVNAAWLEVSLAAIDLLAWTRTLLLHGELADAEPKKLRYRLLHAAARLTRGGRRLAMAARAGERFRLPRGPAKTGHLTIGFVPDRPLHEDLEHPTTRRAPAMPTGRATADSRGLCDQSSSTRADWNGEASAPADP